MTRLHYSNGNGSGIKPGRDEGCTDLYVLGVVCQCGEQLRIYEGLKSHFAISLADLLLYHALIAEMV